LKPTVITSRRPSEIQIPEAIYARIAAIDFSRYILAFATNSLLVFRLKDTKWSDLGDPYRVLVTFLEKHGDLPVWAKLWFEPEVIHRSAAAVA
jgi:hypothetical protein